MATNDDFINGFCDEELSKDFSNIDLSALGSLINDEFSDLNLPDTPPPNVPELNFTHTHTPEFTFNHINPPISEDEDENSSTNSSETKSNIQGYPCDIKDWDNTHIMKWILELYDAKNYRYEDLNIHFFRDKTGSCLADLKESFWMEIDNGRGSWLYKEVQCLINVLKCKKITTEQTQIHHVPRKRGRPPKSNSKPRNKEKVGRIWEFLRDLLKDAKYCPKYIRWDNYEKLEFCLVEPKTICDIWGQKKGKTISYEHFSRSIRHYYKLDKDDPESNKAKILSVRDRRLVYKFNRNALVPEDYNQFHKYW